MASLLPGRSVNMPFKIILLRIMRWLKPDHGSDENHPGVDVRINSSLTKFIQHLQRIAIPDHPLPCMGGCTDGE
jgi:hypothetical protein